VVTDVWFSYPGQITPNLDSRCLRTLYLDQGQQGTHSAPSPTQPPHPATHTHNTHVVLCALDSISMTLKLTSPMRKA
jgi:hypothetical protein